ncbi:hypothetical protein PILCRDRAFT_365303 [Piloderma croceum F 1598]|uniref:Uncharacterized protein n=1 Tax=Piloderma croceum (strain F 1598) TaxID=765440 RepID=A0A0C3G491_PILCF|nr:hypothetical protein PILCRDRAFT_365303 [Piloderma croceum F 1598]
MPSNVYIKAKLILDPSFIAVFLDLYFWLILSPISIYSCISTSESCFLCLVSIFVSLHAFSFHGFRFFAILFRAFQSIVVRYCHQL